MTIGDCVKIIQLPDWVADLPQESRRVFEFCLGQHYPIIGQDDHLFVLDVSTDIDQRFGGIMNDIRLEATYLKRVSCNEQAKIT